MIRPNPHEQPFKALQATAARRRFVRSLMRLLLPGLGVLALLAPVASAAGGQGETAGASTTANEPPTTTSTSPAAEAPAETEGQAGAPASTTTTTEAPSAPSTQPGEAETPSGTAAPEVQAQSPQPQSSPAQNAPTSGKAHHRGHRRTAHSTGAETGGAAVKKGSKEKTAPLPSALTPPFPTSLGTPISGIPDFFIESFRIPPFLLPIYQAAGTAYGIPWQVLAAINEVETDYGRDLSVSSAGAEGWMQFLPSSWAMYGVDANGDGYEDPYNPADAIFAAARYLAAAGGTTNIRAAVYSYNHSQAYVDSVMLRAQLLGGTPPELLAAITGLTESRFPVHAPSHFADGFPDAPGATGGTLVGTTIYAPAGAPVIAVQDGQITAVGDSPTLGRYISLRDAYGNTYTYAQLGSVAELYPVLEPRDHTAVSRLAAPGSTTKPGVGAGPVPNAPASAGVQPHSPLSEGAVVSGLTMGAAASLETAPAPAAPTPPPKPPAKASTPRVFRAGPDEVYLHALRPGVEVLAGTVLGHLGASGETEGRGTASNSAQPTAGTSLSSVAGQPEAHMLFQIRPAGAGAPLIDPKPILDGWVQLENTSIFRAKGENPFLANSPTVGQVLLESKPQLEQQVLRDPGIRFAAECGRGEVRAGQVDRRVLATLEFLSVSGLRPTVSPLGRCGRTAGVAGAGNAVGSAAGDALDISAIDGVPIAGHEGPGSLADITVRRLLRLQGTMKPRQIITGSLSYPGTQNTLTLPSDRGLIHIGFEPVGGARAARALAATPLTPSQWLQLISRLGEIPDPTVASKPSAAAIPDPTSAGSSSASVGQAAPSGNGTSANSVASGQGGD
jgi:Transglycosylase SLT domain